MPLHRDDVNCSPPSPDFHPFKDMLPSSNVLRLRPLACKAATSMGVRSPISKQSSGVGFLMSSKQVTTSSTLLWLGLIAHPESTSYSIHRLRRHSKKSTRAVVIVVTTLCLDYETNQAELCVGVRCFPHPLLEQQTLLFCLSLFKSPIFTPAK